MKFVAIAPLVGLASAAFKYQVLTTDGSCDGCSSLADSTDPDEVSACLATLDPSCQWIVTATWDGTSLPAVASLCPTSDSQIFKFPAELSDRLTFPDPSTVVLSLQADAFRIDFEHVTENCTLDSYTAFLPADPTCGASVDGWTGSAPLVATAGTPVSWETKLNYVNANYIQFVPRCSLSATSYLKPNATSVGKFVVYAIHVWNPNTSTASVADTTSSEDASMPGSEETSGEVSEDASASSPMASSEDASVPGSEETSGEVSEDASASSPMASSEDASVPGSEEASGEVSEDASEAASGDASASTEGIRPWIAVSSLLFAAGYLIF